ncbi:MAG: hypothetical protein JNL28_09110 [Planctomycetes bacterium]|nr:hypothetical protein [Planctomycetota bacterium]
MRCTTALVTLTLLCGACGTVRQNVEPLAIVRLAADRDLYELRRVGILPIVARDLRLDEERALQGALALHLSARMHAEVVVLDRNDVTEVPNNEPFRTGRIEPKAVLALARRYNLDGFVTTNITERRTYAPQRLGLEIELTACDTGLPIWSSSLRLDAAQERTQRALRAWFANERGTPGANETADLYLLSPLRFAEFAAAQVGMSY